MYFCTVDNKIVATSKIEPIGNIKNRGKWLAGIEVMNNFDPDIHNKLGPTLQIKEDYVEVVYTIVPREDAVAYKQSIVQDSLNKKFEEESKSITSGYSEDVIKTWTQQDREARSFNANANAITPMLDGISTKRGIDKTILKDRILYNSEAWSAVVGDLLGRMQAIEDMIYVEGITIEELVRISNEEINSGW